MKSKTITSDMHKDLYDFIENNENGNVELFAANVGNSTQNITRLFRPNANGKYPFISGRLLKRIVEIYKDKFNRNEYPALFAHYEEQVPFDTSIEKEKAERLNEMYSYLLRHGLTKSKNDLARKINCSLSTISSAFNANKFYITDKLLKRINSVFDNIFNEDWMISGKGAMLRTEKKIVVNAEKINPDISNLITIIAKQQDLIKSLMDELNSLKETMNTLRKGFDSLNKEDNNEKISYYEDCNILKQD